MTSIPIGDILVKLINQIENDEDLRKSDVKLTCLNLPQTELLSIAAPIAFLIGYTPPGQEPTPLEDREVHHIVAAKIMAKIAIGKILFRDNPLGHLALQLHTFGEASYCFTLVHGIQEFIFRTALWLYSNEKAKNFIVEIAAPAIKDLCRGDFNKFGLMINFLLQEVEKEKVKTPDFYHGALKLLQSLIPAPKFKAALFKEMGSFVLPGMHQLDVQQFPTKGYNYLALNLKFRFGLSTGLKIESSRKSPISKAIADKIVSQNLGAFKFQIINFGLRLIKEKNAILTEVQKWSKRTQFFSQPNYELARCKVEFMNQFCDEWATLVELQGNLEFSFYIDNYYNGVRKEWEKHRKGNLRASFFTFFINKLKSLTQETNTKYLGHLRKALQDPEYAKSRKETNRFRDYLKDLHALRVGLFEPIFCTGELLRIEDEPGLQMDGPPRFVSFQSPTKFPSNAPAPADKGDSKGGAVKLSVVVPENETTSSGFSATGSTPSSPANSDTSSTAGSPVAESTTSLSLTPMDTSQRAEESFQTLKAAVKQVLEFGRKALRGDHYKEAEIQIHTVLAALRRLFSEKDRPLSVVTVLSHSAIALEQLLKACFLSEYSERLRKCSNEAQREALKIVREQVLYSHDLYFIAEQLLFADQLSFGDFQLLEGINKAEQNARYVELLFEFFPQQLSTAQQLLQKAIRAPFSDMEEQFSQLLPRILLLIAKIANQNKEGSFPVLRAAVDNYLHFLHHPESTKKRVEKPSHPQLLEILESIKELHSEFPLDDASEGFLNNFEHNLFLRAMRAVTSPPEKEEMYSHFNTLFQAIPWIVENMLCLMLTKAGFYDLDIIYNHDFEGALKLLGIKDYDKKFLERILLYRQLRYPQTQSDPMVAKILKGINDLSRRDVVGDDSDGFEMNKGAAKTVFQELEEQLINEWKLLDNFLHALMNQRKADKADSKR